jgi:hypothetical protein
MHDNSAASELAQRYPHLAGRTGVPAADMKEDEGEDCCQAFGFLRGLHERALTVELRFRDGNRHGFAYSCFVEWWYNPSVGLLLKFTGDLVTLVLIGGSNLDATIEGKGINLTERGIPRHRITWVREKEEDELRRAGEGVPTIDRIEVGQFETQEELRDWLKMTAPGFIRHAP